MSRVKTDNPAGRLHGILSKAKTIQEGAPAAVWSKVFSISPASDLSHLTEVVQRLNELQQLVDETEKGFTEFENDSETYLESIAPIRKVILTSFQGLNNNMTGLLNPVSERHMTLLEMGAAEWSRRIPEPKIDEKQLEEILKQVRELFEAVKRATDVDEELRTLILSMLDSIERAIQKYRVVGPSALEESIVQILGQLHWKQHVFLEKAPKGSKERKLLKKVGAIGTALIAVMTFADKTRKTVETFGQDILFLTSGEPEIPPVDLREMDKGSQKDGGTGLGTKEKK
jgi:hypothetical protein